MSIKFRIRAGLLILAASFGGICTVQAQQDVWRGVSPQVLNEKAFTDVIGVLKQTSEAGIELDISANSTDEQALTAVKKHPRFMAILDTHGHSPEDYLPVMVNVLNAFTAQALSSRAEVFEEQAAQFEAAKIQLDERKESMSEEAYEASKARWEESKTEFDKRKSEFDAVQAQVANVPEENIELAAKFRDDLSKIDPQDL